MSSNTIDTEETTQTQTPQPKRKPAATEAKRLEKLYLGALRKNAVGGAHILNTKSEAWLEATKETRAACDVALANLNRHR